MKQYVANSLEDLCMYIQEIKLSEETTLWYRGHSDLLWDLVPSIQRNGIEKKNKLLLILSIIPFHKCRTKTYLLHIMISG